MRIIAMARVEIKCLFSGHPFWFQQDGTSSHTSSMTHLFLGNQFSHVIPASHWLANSPDLNVVENLWGVIMEEVTVHNCKTKQELRARIVDAWNHIPINLCRCLVDSVPHHLQQCIEHKGAWIDYWRRGIVCGDICVESMFSLVDKPTWSSDKIFLTPFSVHTCSR